MTDNGFNVEQFLNDPEVMFFRATFEEDAHDIELLKEAAELDPEIVGRNLRTYFYANDDELMDRALDTLFSKIGQISDSTPEEEINLLLVLLAEGLQQEGEELSELGLDALPIHPKDKSPKAFFDGRDFARIDKYFNRFLNNANSESLEMFAKSAYEKAYQYIQSKNVRSLSQVDIGTLSSNENFYQIFLRCIEHVDEPSDDLVERLLRYSYSFPDSQKVQKIINNIGEISDQVRIDAEIKHVSELLYRGGRRSIMDAVNFIERSGLSSEEIIKSPYTTPFWKSIMKNFELNSVQDFKAFCITNRRYLMLSREEKDTETRFDKNTLEEIKHMAFGDSLAEAEALARSGIQLKMPEDQDEETYFMSIRNALIKEGLFSDETDIDLLDKGIEVFGAKTMMNYIGTIENFHIAVHQFEQILTLFKKSGLSETEFAGNILMQAAKSQAEYSAGNAMAELNAIAIAMNEIDFERILVKIRNLSGIAELEGFKDKFTQITDIFTSFPNLIQFYSRMEYLNNEEFLDLLDKLEKNGQSELASYVRVLMWHRDSKVSSNAIKLFLSDEYIEGFFAARSSHTPTEAHDRKKPSNYFHIPNLDLTPVELRNSLVEGIYDELQVFPHMQARLTYRKVGDRPLRERLIEGLGKRSEKIPGNAKNPGKLFSEANKLFKSSGLKIGDYLSGDASTVTPELSNAIEALLYSEDFGLDAETVTYVVQIGRKSDPLVALAGNDTASCMPFGDGKNTLYTFNPNCAQLIVQTERPDGEKRTLAQSVITKDIDTGVTIPILTGLLETEEHLRGAIPKQVTLLAKRFLACDNVEINPSVKDTESITKAIQDFLTLYLEDKDDTIDHNKVIVGMGYTRGLQGLEVIENTFLPQAPVAYSDKYGAEVYKIPIDKAQSPNLLKAEVVGKSEATKVSIPEYLSTRNLDLLTFQDTLPVGYLEGKAYEDAPELLEYLFNMENALIAKDVNNKAKGRPNMSLKYTTGEGAVSGYILAYEGVIDDDKLPDLEGTNCIFISDLATDLETELAGGRLIQGFVNRYSAEYLQKGNLTPIFLQAREQTSYRIITRQLARIGRNLGVNFEIEEFEPEKRGKDTMYPMLIRPRRIV